MAQNGITVKEAIKILKQFPGDLKLRTLDDGLCYQITTIKIRYIKPTIDWTKNKCFIEVDEYEERAGQAIILE